MEVLKYVHPLTVKHEVKVDISDLDKDYTEMVRRLRGEPEVIDVTPQ
jgi:hypothetical protein